MMKRIAKGILRRMAFVKPIFEALAQVECRIAASWASSAHRRLFAAQWGIPPHPEHFDHNIDLFYQWLSTRNSLGIKNK